jgi:hypothetical protein
VKNNTFLRELGEGKLRVDVYKDDYFELSIVEDLTTVHQEYN